MDNWLESLRDALDLVEYGIVLLDDDLQACFINRAFRRMWALPEYVEGEAYTFETLMQHGSRTGAYPISPQHLGSYVADRIAQVKAGHDGPRLLTLADDRVLKFECVPLPGGGRMLTYADQSALIHAVEKLEEIIHIDDLTKLNNRRFLSTCGENEVARAKRYVQPLSVVTLNLDHFKQINAEYGHDAGDMMLCAVAQCCRDATRATDVIGRLGGDEFALILPATTLAAAMVVAEKARRKIAAIVIHIGPLAVKITASFGVVTVTEHKRTFEDLLSSANSALQSAKANGRNTVVSAPQ
ncbi:diguanylate cyclase [Undibacterium sp.]|jgi:diguanylate cyclase (GGDEF)-like protein|uniref:GGDEF domain-containing protein n=1 Tax=Undibacterium sp. TaxID=1914977 RepID=UPI002CB53DCE|nr:diguanylate cyclase [Undibacterium sp.]HTD06674.1 diguanylate cyclase [Undibacterium sp.]